MSHLKVTTYFSTRQLAQIQLSLIYSHNEAITATGQISNKKQQKFGYFNNM